MERRVVAGLALAKRLVYLLTFVPQSFMALHQIIIDIGENLFMGGWWTAVHHPPMEFLCVTFYKKKLA